MRRLSILLLIELGAVFATLFVVHHYVLDWRVRRLFGAYDAILDGDSLVVHGIEHSRLEKALDLRICRIAQSGGGIYGVLVGHLYAKELGKPYFVGTSFPMMNRRARLDYSRYPFRMKVLSALYGSGGSWSEMVDTAFKAFYWEVSMVPAPGQPLRGFEFLTDNDWEYPAGTKLDLKELEAYEAMSRAVEAGVPLFRRRLEALASLLRAEPPKEEVFFELRTTGRLNEMIRSTAPAQRAAMQKTLGSLGVPFLEIGDFVDPARPDTEYFHDLTHLNGPARSLATDELAAKLKTALGR